MPKHQETHEVGMSTASRKIGELLVDQRLLSRDDLEYLLPREAESGIPLAKLLVDEGYVREEDLLRTVAGRVGMEYVEMKRFDASKLRMPVL